jgi:4-hydroxybenzoate polyprenyltransferase
MRSAERRADRPLALRWRIAIDRLTRPSARQPRTKTAASAHALARAMRPVHWTKNLLLFAGIVFAAELGDLERWTSATLLFAAYCAASSAAYLFNDIRDVELDRRHPVKRARPIASGELAVGTAATASAVLAVAAAALALAVEPEALLFLGAFVAVQVGYSLGLKHVAVADVFAIAALFVVRAVAGAQGIDVSVSPWLVLCTGLIALFLALCKRRAELVLVGADATPTRPVLDGYSLELVDQYVSIVAAATIASYAIYSFTGAETEAMMLTIPFVVFGLFRYLFLVHRRGRGEEPEHVLLTDPWILATVAVWAGLAAGILALA